MNIYFGNGEIFYYHVSFSDTRPARKEEGTFWITSNYGYLRCVGNYLQFMDFCRKFNINPYYVG